jgi:hypothetical protein
MDHCSAHVTDEVIRLLTKARVRAISYAPHITPVFQVIDLTLFAFLTKRPTYELPFGHETPESEMPEWDRCPKPHERIVHCQTDQLARLRTLQGCHHRWGDGSRVGAELGTG